MTSLSMQAETTPPAEGVGRVSASARTAALAAFAVGTLSSVAFALITVTATLTNTTSKNLAFHHTGDYWYTGIGIPTAIATAVLLVALRALQPTARPRLTTFGAGLNAAALAVLTAMLSYSVATGAEARWGGTYIIATLATFVGHILFSAGSWRTGLIPRPLLTAWPVVWLLGAFAAQGASPLLLAALYVCLGVLVVRRVHG
jgi:hypothetical protein